jgi:tetratricopeptide (TPR) repeat protein
VAESIRVNEISTDKKTLTTEALENKVSIRVSPKGYFAAMFLFSFFAVFFTYLEYDFLPKVLLAVAWFFVPLLYLSDKIIFDGISLKRTGLVPRLFSIFGGESTKLQIAEIQQVETQAMRAVRRGGSVFYRYQTLIMGNEKRFILSSGGENYRNLVKNLFQRISDDTLDNRSIELRDYLTEPKESLMKAEFARLPSSEVLENSRNEFLQADRKLRSRRNNFAINEDDIEKSNNLRQIANELRLSGYLLQSLEAFRRALLLNPKDAWLIFEFARCLSSFAGMEQNPKLEKKAHAALRLAAIRSNNDAELLARLGESYFQFGDWERAKKVFQQALEVASENFRSARGLAEISLREGKIAHVLHHFTTAIRSADTNALKNWVKGEIEYFTQLNNDEEYMDLEIRRINFLEGVQRGKGMVLRFALLGLPIILFGGLIDENLISQIGWAISAVSLSIWAILLIGENIFSNRCPILKEEE